MTNHKLSLLHGKLEYSSMKRNREAENPKKLKKKQEKKKRKISRTRLSRALSVLTALSLNLTHSLPAYNNNTSFSHTNFVVIIIYQMKSLLFWGVQIEF